MRTSVVLSLFVVGLFCIYEVSAQQQQPIYRKAPPAGNQAAGTGYRAGTGNAHTATAYTRPLSPVEMANIEYKQCKQRCQMFKQQATDGERVQRLRTELLEAEKYLEQFARQNAAGDPPHPEAPKPVIVGQMPVIAPAPELPHVPLNYAV